MPIVDTFDGWLVIDHEALKAAWKQLPPYYRKYKVVRKELKIGPQQISDYLEGRRYTNLLNFKKLCLYVQISADALLGLSFTETPPTDN